MSRAPFLRWGGLFGTHPRVTKTSEIRSGSVDACAFGVVVGAGAFGLLSAFVGSPWGALASCTVCVAVCVVHRAWARHQTAKRWREAVRRRDELKAARAEAVRLHRPVSQIDAELRPLVNRMMSGAI